MIITKMRSNKTGWRRSKRKEAGSAVLVVIALIAIIFIYIAANLSALHNLHRELRLIEKRQIQRLQTRPGSGATPAQMTGTTNSPVSAP